MMRAKISIAVKMERNLKAETPKSKTASIQNGTKTQSTFVLSER